MRTFPLFLLLPFLAFLVLPACGGGGGGAPGATGGEAKPGPTQVLVQMAPGEEGEVDEIGRETGATLVGNVAGTSYWLFELPADMSVATFQTLLEDDARVVGAEEDVEVAAPEGGEGGGATLPLGGDLFAVQIPDQEALLRIGLLQAHERTRGAGVRVAVVDSGVLPLHEVLVGRLEPGGWDFVDGDPDPTDEANGIDDDGDGHVDEGYGHGTFVTSLVLAVAPDATILPFRVLDDESFGRVSDIAEAISAATAAGVDVINLSLGTAHRVDVVREAVRNAVDLGVAVIVSAGNTGGRDVTFPASISDALSVTAVDAADVRAPFASYGEDVDLSAPGVELIGAYPNAGGAVRWSGTSFSAAIVSGGFALVRSLHADWSADEIRQHLRDTSADVDPTNPGFAGDLGRGRIDLDAATRP